MKSYYKMLIIILSTAALAACGSNNDENTDDTNASQDTSTADNSNENTDDSTAEDSGSNDDSTEENTNDSNGSIDGSSNSISLDNITTDPADAIATAHENFEGDLVSLELDNDNNTWVYEVNLETSDDEYELQVSVEDLSVINEHTEQDNNINIESFSYDDAVPFNEAVQTAIDEVGGELEGFTLEMEDGQLIYEIEIRDADGGNDYDVVINAETGELITTDD
ncbi:PepSY domain-containing protein [Corticicoccus populi]|uniref:PepSY domain-containing protein n=1 Tax=Corticicoccus populi TaxID=1812821 RepID=A0ABW5WY57_9STAP